VALRWEIFATANAVADLIHMQASHHLIPYIMYKKKTYFNTIPNAHDSTNKVLSGLRHPLQLIIHKVLGINCEKALPF